MILRAAALLTVVLLGGVGDRFIYFPTRYPLGQWDPARHGLTVEDRRFAAADGVALHAWWAPRKGARATVLFLHGNGGNLTNCAGAVARMVERLPVQALLLDYRGYGRSEGRPTEEGLYRDAEAAYEELLRLGVRPEEIVIYGHSLGAAVATELALRRRAAGLVLEAPFTSMQEMVRRALPFLDPEDLVSERYDTLAKVGRVRVPLLVVHGARDRTIPFAMGVAVYEAAPEPKSFLEVPEGGHNDCSLRAGDRFYGKLGELVERALDVRAARGEPALY